MPIPTDKITSISADGVNLNGVTYSISWDAQEHIEEPRGVLRIFGVKDWETLSTLLDAWNTSKAAPVPSRAMPPESAKPTETPKPIAEQVVQAVVAHKATPKFIPVPMRGEEFEPPPVAKPDVNLAPVPSSTPEAKVIDSFAVFARLNLIGEIVEEIVRQGAENYAEVWETCLKLKAAGACPAIDRLHDSGKLEERVQRQCLSRGIVGTP